MIGTTMEPRNLAAILFLVSLAVAPGARAATLAEEVDAFLNVIAVSGREQPAADFIASRLAGGRDVRQEVEDLSQDVFLALFSRDGYVLRTWQAERGLSLENFVGLIAERQVLSFLRSGRRNPWKEEPLLASDELDPEAPESGPEAAASSREHLALLLGRLREELSPLGWRLFELLFVREMSQSEVEAATGLSADAVYAWRSRLRRLAQKVLAEMSGTGATARKA